MTPQDVRYQYSALSERGNQIRLVRLLPGTDMRVHIELYAVVLQPPELIPSYEGLSYTWGDENDLVDISITTPMDSTPRTLPVTRNLYEALRHLRHKNMPRTLWIDAICINQQDSEENRVEKAAQVDRMWLIYRSATSVVAWIGSEANGSSAILEWMQFLASAVIVDWLTSDLAPRQQAEQDALDLANESIGLPMDAVSINDFMSLISRPYFARVWIRQEVLALPGNAKLHCGDMVLPWEDFCSAVYIIWLKPKPDVPRQLEPEFNRLTNLVYRLCRLHGSRYLLDILHSSRVCKCKDPRDRIYAQMHLIEDSTSLRLRSNYTGTLSQTYEDAFKSYANCYNTLNMLAYCEWHDAPSELPTWIPDWTSGETNSMFRRSYSSLRVSACNTPVDIVHKILRVKGVRASIITQIVQLPQQMVRSAAASVLRVYATQMDLVGDYVAGGTKLEAFLNAIVKEQWGDRWVPSPNVFSLEHATRAFERIRDRDIDIARLPEDPDVAMLCAQFLTFAKGQALCASSDGYGGLVPVKTVVGDEIFSIPGCDWPLVLRRDTSSDTKATVVGMCWIPGLMDNEMLLGSLESDYQSVRIAKREWYDFNGPLTAFRHKRTGKLRYTDPRLYNEMSFPIRWFDALSLRPRDEDEKPHISLAQLLKRGVQLEDIYLV